MNYENITLEKGMYGTTKGFAGTLEELDPSENYKGTALEKYDAFQRQLKRFDIKTAGPGCDTVEKFFSTTSSSALFPEFISRCVYKGIEDANCLKDIVAVTTEIKGMDYRAIISNPNTSQTSLLPVNEGATIDETTMGISTVPVQLTKKGRMLTASYEAIRFQKLDVFGVMLRQIGAQIARSEFAEAVDLITTGNNAFQPATGSNTATNGVLTYADLVDFWNTFSPYEMNTLIVPATHITKLLNMTEFKDTNAGQSFHGTGRMITPIGAKLIKAPTGESNVIIGLDRSCAIEKITSGGVITEYDKLIDKQLERAVISTITGFARMFPDAAKVLNVTHPVENNDNSTDVGGED